MKLHQIQSKDELGVPFNLAEKDIIDHYVRIDVANDATKGRYEYLDRNDLALKQTFTYLDDKGPRQTLDDIIARQGHATLLDFGTSTGKQLFSLLNHSHAVYHPGTDIERVTADIVSGEDLSMYCSLWRARAAMLGGIINYECMELESVGPDGPIPAKSYDLITSLDALVGNDAADSIVRGLARALRPEGVLYFNLAEGEEFKVQETVADLCSTGYEVMTLAEQSPSYVGRLSGWIGGWPGEGLNPLPYKVTAPAA